MFVFGLASLFYPPLKQVIGSVTTRSIAIRPEVMPGVS